MMINNKFYYLLIILFCLSVPNTAISLELEIFYWGDFHAQNTPAELPVDGVAHQVGGAAAFSGLLKSMRQKDMRTLILDAGDQFTGQPISSLTKGKSQIKLLKKLKVDAFVPGNHEFDYGWKSLVEVTKKVKFDILLANVLRTKDNSTLFQPHIVYYLDGLSVAIIGLIYQDFTESVIHEGVVGLEVTDPIVVARQFVETFKDSVDLLIALSHSGWEQDSIMASKVRGLNLIIGGHSHTVLPKPRIINTVMIAHAGSKGMYLGHLNMEIDTTVNAITNYNAELIPVYTDSIKADRWVARLVKKFEKKHAKQLDRRIGTLASNWNINKNDQSNMSQWFTDAMREISPRVDLAVINNGNLRKNLERGEILERDIWEICPFENSIIIFQISGIELINSVNYLIKTPRDFMTWSGLKVTASNDQINSMIVNGTDVIPQEEYSVITTGYVWDHLKSYLNIVPDKRNRPFFFMPGNQREFMIKAVKSESVISKGLDGRWTVE